MTSCWLCAKVINDISQNSFSRTPQYHCSQIHTHGMKYTNNKNNISEILKVYIINSITKSYILNIKIRSLVTKYALTIKLVSSVHSFNPYAYFGHSSYYDIQNLRLVILYVLCTMHLWNNLSQVHSQLKDPQVRSESQLKDWKAT